jgi:hypothetical protein
MAVAGCACRSDQRPADGRLTARVYRSRGNRPPIRFTHFKEFIMVLLSKSPARNRPVPGPAKVIFTRDCFARDNDDGAALEHRAAGEVRTVSNELAFDLAVMCGAALYVNAEDDPSPNKAYSLTPEKKAALDCETGARKAAQARKEQAEQDAAEELQYARAARRELIARHGQA